MQIGESEQSRSFHTIQGGGLDSKFKKRSEFTKKYQNYFKVHEAKGKNGVIQTSVSSATPVGRANLSIFTREEQQQGSVESIKNTRELSHHQKKLQEKHETKKLEKDAEQLEQLVGWQ